MVIVILMFVSALGYLSSETFEKWRLRLKWHGFMLTKVIALRTNR
jgi:hypothetical protein